MASVSTATGSRGETAGLAAGVLTPSRSSRRRIRAPLACRWRTGTGNRVKRPMRVARVVWSGQGGCYPSRPGRSRVFVSSRAAQAIPRMGLGAQPSWRIQRTSHRVTLPLENGSLAEWFNTGKESRNDEDGEVALHAGVQAGGGAAGAIWAWRSKRCSTGSRPAEKEGSAGLTASP